MECCLCVGLCELSAPVDGFDVVVCQCLAMDGPLFLFRLILFLTVSHFALPMLCACMMQDSGKTIQDLHSTFVDLNRAGVGLMEIVRHSCTVPLLLAVFGELLLRERERERGNEGGERRLGW